MIEGQVEEFGLVGMDHWNAMFEDASTGSWWRQVSGEAVAGERKGQYLPEVPSRQMSWQALLELHPDSKVKEPDPAFAAQYARFEGFAEGTSRESSPAAIRQLAGKILSSRSGSRPDAHAFDWNELVEKKSVAATLGGNPPTVRRRHAARNPAGLSGILAFLGHLQTQYHPPQCQTSVPLV